MTSPTPPAEPTYADRTFRSPAGIAGGVMLLLLICWLGGDALIRGHGRVPWLALAGMLTVVPLVVAFTVRPVVSANEQRIRVRNPFRTIVAPWTEVADLRAGYSSELFTEGGAKYQMWAVPVSLRQRKRAARQQSRDVAVGASGRTSPPTGARDTSSRMAPADRAMTELRELAERARASARTAAAEAAPAEPDTAADAGTAAAVATAAEPSVAVRWAYEVIAPAVAGAVLFVVLLAIG
ncbi:PH domain-containing protein [Streptomyces sp. NPDC014734]|uniref:PH domain-containing protein n=1 Tax=Streptomyces sp. NPDC014734 TaxID=3364886 RepID=UPI0036FE6782